MPPEFDDWVKAVAVMMEEEIVAAAKEEAPKLDAEPAESRTIT